MREELPFHKSRTKAPYAIATRPPEPIGLSLLISALCKSSRKYLVSSVVCERHCSPAFIKQVLPRFYNPVRPAYAFPLSIFESSRFKKPSPVTCSEPSLMTCLLSSGSAGFSLTALLRKNSLFLLGISMTSTSPRAMLASSMRTSFSKAI